ncbi:sensor histidine kinase [Parageobacillus thermoglucosidasius]|uniref:sensor histidine kinase n=1 Tax=Parageobacillus thermoglucosidasius TaxID=1426 RepID=UPI000B562108|nr:ATP-binding protein [Parageobacillus thermoglucosidasius]MBY6269813.1 two-component sensor histidine kinase [Parageobacillus thermoglucosidasius]OUM85101.1 MAG: two-component sensor histidine kinase [Parageobacillus thermoglucosidasius]
MRKISFKLGLLFFVFVLGIETVLFASLYITLVHSRINEEFEQLLARGNSHRDVLEKNYDPSTLEHVTMMESEAETDVVITDDKGKILYFSDHILPAAQKIIKKANKHIPHDGMIVQKDWQKESHISTVSPIRIAGKIKGYVYMFQNTDSIQNMIDKLKHHFMMVGILSVFLTIITIALLSRIITIPLIRMKQATEKLSKGDFSVHLQVKGEDELAELGKAIQTLARDLEYLKKERNEFLASISHELRTPLTYVKGYADIARRSNMGEEERNRYLSIIYEEAEHMQKLVKDLFELAKMDQHSFQIHKELTNLCSFFKKLHDKMQPAFQAKKMSLVYYCDGSITVHIDQKRFEQVMMNLLDNALKYSDQGSIVSIDVRKEKHHIVIIVSDAGRGIPEEDLPHIFERFYRVDKSRSRTSGGTGLGLAIVKEIVEAHGGAIYAASEYGKGTNMIITLPEG